MHAFHQNGAFLLIVTEKPADFCGTLQKSINTRNDKQNASPERLTFCHIAKSNWHGTMLRFTPSYVSYLIYPCQ